MKKVKKINKKVKKTQFDKSNDLRQYVLTMALNRFNSMEKTENKVFTMSTYSLLRRAFGLDNKRCLDDININYAIYMVMQGIPIEDIAKKLEWNINTLRSRLCRIYNDCDVSSSNDLKTKLLLWTFQQLNIILLPSDDYICEPLTKEKIKELVI